ncbi:S-methyl-5-thioribose-1-phosphate isomerase, partial [bacterium]|nr:S-methyl-5-thioribose-1-phosphate isomerase [bacterium]
MQDLIGMSIRFSDGRLLILDQQKLPEVEEWIECNELEQMISAIQLLKVRGAPAIAVAASLFVGSLAIRGMEREGIIEAIELLRAARPTAVNLMHAMDLLREITKSGLATWREDTVAEARRVFEEDVALCDRIAQNGAALLENAKSILTHCNTGGLATAGCGTALGIITTAARLNDTLHVWVDETRPLLQGARLTAWELNQSGVSHALICDSMAGSLMAEGRVDCVIVGADRIAANGDFANKIGTYSLAVLAHYHKVPFYIAAPHTTIDSDCPSGKEIPIEQRSAEEVRGFVHTNNTFS